MGHVHVFFWECEESDIVLAEINRLDKSVLEYNFDYSSMSQARPI